MPLIKKLWLQFTGYKAVLGWILSHAFARYLKDIWKIFAWGLASAVGQFAGLGLILIYAKSLETRSPISLYGVTIHQEPSLLSLIMVVAAILSLMVFASIFQFAAYRRTVALSCRYEEDLIRKTISEASQKPLVNPGEEPYDTDWLKVKVIRDARICSRVLFLLITNLVDLLFFVVFATFAFWIDWVTTSIFSVFLILYCALLYRINIRAAISSLALERMTSPATQEKLKIIHRIESTTDVIAEDDPELDYIFKKGATHRQLRAYERRMTIISEAQFLSNCFSAFAICGVFFMVGISIFDHRETWSHLLTYFLTLRILMGKLTKLGTALTNVSRLYPHVKRFFELHNVTSAGTLVTPPSESGEKAFRLPSLAGETDLLELVPGKPIALISPVPTNRTLISSLLSHKKGEILGPVALVAAPALSDRRSLYTVLGIDFKRISIETELQTFGFRDEYKEYFPRGINTKLCDVPHNVRNGLVFLLSAIAARDKRMPIVFIDGPSLSTFSAHARNQILSWFDERLLFIRLPSSKALANKLYKNSVAIVFRGNKPLGWAMAGWLATHLKALPIAQGTDVDRVSTGTKIVLDEPSYD